MVDRRVPIVALVLAAPDASTAVREAAAPRAARTAGTSGGLALATCHRVELYVADEAAEVVAGSGDWADARRLEGSAAVRHAVGVAVGLESAVLGEDQVLHQLRSSVSAARDRGGLATPLEVLFEQALRAGRTARSWRPRRARSMADLAVERLRAVHGGTIDGRRVLVIGAGEMGRLAALAASRAGASVAIASPTPAHAASVAASVGGTAVAFDPGPRGVAVDAAIVALSGPWIAASPTVERLADVPIVVDLSMPPALPPALSAALGDRHVDLDGLASSAMPAAGEDRATERYRARLLELRDRTVDACLDRLAARRSTELAAVLAHRIERERAAELDALWRRLPGLAAEERAAIEGMTRHLAERLFRAPLSNLGADRDGRRGQVARELFDL